MGRRLALLALIALLIAACGSDDQAQGPTTSSPGPPSSGAAAPAATAATTVDACPQPAWLAPGAYADPPAGYAAAVAPLEADQAAVQAWGEQHADRFSGAWLDLDGGQGRLVVAVTGQPSEAQAEVAGTVTHPDRLVVCPHRHSLAELRDSASQVASAGGADAQATADGVNDVVAVRLPADQQATAARLADQFGERVHLTVGLLPYPMPSGAAPLTTGPCRPLPAAASDDGLSAQLVLGPSSVGPGGQARGTVHIRNSTTQPVDLRQPKPLDVVLVRPEDGKVLGANPSTPDPADYGGPIDAGGTMSLPVVAGTASCDPSVGYVVPPGSYQAVAVVPRAGADGAADAASPPVVSDPVPLTVTG